MMGCSMIVSRNGSIIFTATRMIPRTTHCLSGVTSVRHAAIRGFVLSRAVPFLVQDDPRHPFNAKSTP